MRCAPEHLRPRPGTRCEEDAVKQIAATETRHAAIVTLLGVLSFLALVAM